MQGASHVIAQPESTQHLARNQQVYPSLAYEDAEGAIEWAAPLRASVSPLLIPTGFTAVP